MACAKSVKNRLAAALTHQKQRKKRLAAAAVRTAFSHIHPGRAARTPSKSPNPSRPRSPQGIAKCNADPQVFPLCRDTIDSLTPDCYWRAAVGSSYIFSTMPQTYDTTFKELFAQNFVALLCWLIPDVESYEVLKLPEELPLTARRADLMVRVDGRASNRSLRLPSAIQIFDCQVQRDPRLPRSMLIRAVLAPDLYDLPVKTTLLALTPKAVVQARYVFGTDDNGEVSRHSITVRRVFEESADAALQSDLAELLPLVPVMQAGNGDQAGLVHQVIERIVERVLADEKRKIMLEQAANFATLRLPRTKVSDIVQDVLGRKRIMIDPLRDFPLVRDGYRKGIREGMLEGIREGKSAGKAESVLMLLETRGVRVSKTLRDKILSCHDPATLDRWFKNAISAASASEVFATP